ncbi:class I SAM-dependent methyltransferase [Kangiella sp. TOML190]|uniref:class I SAM-dependent methyltransferase n=1 Tax=Kangiella sp. TOML190 TaxID=2931351 RepID=UPI00203DC1C7|nr:class I SAM-dependent methyltransferase [Kangiella sp. TOML190]
MTCPLCHEQSIHFYHQDNQRNYWQCGRCELVFVKPQEWLSFEQEKAIYDLHQNDADDLGYRRFLNKLVEPLAQRLAPDAEGLDFGCGPGPTLSTMFAELGFIVEDYDPLYFDKPELLQQQYDFICATEVIEHLHDPHNQLNLLLKMLKPKGKLGIMTKRVIDQQAFARWHYKNDMTHIAFYSKTTFEYICKHLYKDAELKLEIINSDTLILSKK